MSFTWVVFDLGEVLSVSPPHLAELAELAASGTATGPVDTDAFIVAYWAHRDRYDAGGSPTSYWTQLIAESGASAAPELIERLTEIDVNARIVLREDSLVLLEDVRRSEAHIGLLSNAPEPLARAVRAQPWSELFDVAVFSADVGVNKPDRAIYDAALERYGVEPGQLLFFDDRQVNVDGAIAAGWRAHRWTGAADARMVLRGAGVL